LSGAEKIVRTPIGGIIDLSAINSGIIKISKPKKVVSIESGIKGKVIGVMHNNEINISTDTLKIKLFKVIGSSFLGKFIVFDSNTNFEMQDSVIYFKGKINLQILKNFSLHGVKAVILDGIDYLFSKSCDFEKSFNLQVGVISGFGDPSQNNEIIDVFEKNNSSICFLDNQKSEIVFPTKIIEEKKTISLYKSIEKGIEVELLGSHFPAIYGKVSECLKDEIKVDFENSNEHIYLNPVNSIAL